MKSLTNLGFSSLLCVIFSLGSQSTDALATKSDSRTRLKVFHKISDGENADLQKTLSVTGLQNFVDTLLSHLECEGAGDGKADEDHDHTADGDHEHTADGDHEHTADGEDHDTKHAGECSKFLVSFSSLSMFVSLSLSFLFSLSLSLSLCLFLSHIISLLFSLAVFLSLSTPYSNYHCLFFELFAKQYNLIFCPFF